MKERLEGKASDYSRSDDAAWIRNERLQVMEEQKKKRMRSSKPVLRHLE
jgi:hypothetical protein